MTTTVNCMNCKADLYTVDNNIIEDLILRPEDFHPVNAQPSILSYDSVPVCRICEKAWLTAQAHEDENGTIVKQATISTNIGEQTFIIPIVDVNNAPFSPAGSLFLPIAENEDPESSIMYGLLKEIEEQRGIIEELKLGQKDILNALKLLKRDMKDVGIKLRIDRYIFPKSTTNIRKRKTPNKTHVLGTKPTGKGGLTIAEEILKAVGRSKKGLNAIQISEKTGYDKKKVSNHIFIAKKKGLIVSLHKGIYIKNPRNREATNVLKDIEERSEQVDASTTVPEENN